MVLDILFNIITNFKASLASEMNVICTLGSNFFNSMCSYFFGFFNSSNETVTVATMENVRAINAGLIEYNNVGTGSETAIVSYSPNRVEGHSLTTIPATNIVNVVNVESTLNSVVNNLESAEVERLEFNNSTTIEQEVEVSVIEAMPLSDILANEGLLNEGGPSLNELELFLTNSEYDLNKLSPLDNNPDLNSLLKREVWNDGRPYRLYFDTALTTKEWMCLSYSTKLHIKLGLILENIYYLPDGPEKDKLIKPSDFFGHLYTTTSLFNGYNNVVVNLNNNNSPIFKKVMGDFLNDNKKLASLGNSREDIKYLADQVISMEEFFDTFLAEISMEEDFDTFLAAVRES